MRILTTKLELEIISLMTIFNKKKREINDNIFNKQNHSELMNNYNQSN